ncbi:MAG: hypothetical protein EHM50_01090 [Lysobacterales bacterium]|nr:MAG: hypothetical protein EHM50_01090 [Xanthomonadales bacterium]
MKVETVTISPPESGQPTTKADAEVVMVEVSGPTDPDDALIKRARELVLSTGSAAMIKSFDWALESEALVTED